MPVTFGSVGDIIAVCVLVKDCVDALSSTKGSTAAYQAVIRELYILEKALLEVELICREYAGTPGLDTLIDSARTTVDGCQKSLAAFTLKTKKYEPHFDNATPKSATRKIVAGSAMKMLWQISMSDEVTRFRAEIVAYSLSLSQLLATANIHLSQGNYKKLQAKLQESHNQTTASLARGDKKLKDIQSRLKEVDQRLSSGMTVAARLAQQANVRLEWLNQLGQDLRTLMQKIISINLATYKCVVEIQRALLVSPLTNEPIFYLEDAIGRVSPITLQFITCWDALQAVLEVRFRGIQGSKKVLRKEYALQYRATGKDIDLTRTWEGAFLPGQWVDMSMVFQETGKVSNENDDDICPTPTCKARSNQPPGVEVRCSVCKLVYQRRVIDVTYDDVMAADSRGAHVPAPDAPDSQSPRYVSPQSERAGSGSSTRSQTNKGGKEDDQDDDPSVFRRVIVKSRKRRKSHVQSAGLQATGKDPDDVTERESSHAGKDETNNLVGETPQIQEVWCGAVCVLIPANYYSTLEYLRRAIPEGSVYWRQHPESCPLRHRTPIRDKPTEEDARRAGIPAGYSYKNWDPTQEPIILLGSVFDADSLGKWIYDWTVHHVGRGNPMEEMAGDLWVQLMQLAWKVKRAEMRIPKVRSYHGREMLEDFLESGERLWIKFAKLLKRCEDYMWRAAMVEPGGKKPVSMGKNSAFEFVDSIFGKDRELESTEKLMEGLRLWNTRFDDHCFQWLSDPPAVDVSEEIVYEVD